MCKCIKVNVYKFDVGNISSNGEVILYHSSLKRPSAIDCTHTSPCYSQERVVFVIVSSSGRLFCAL